MPSPRALTLTLLALLGLAWSLTLALGGVWLFAGAPPAWGGLGEGARRVTGVTAFVAGNLVFLTCVADRIVPGVGRKLSLPSEVLLCGLLFAGLLATAWRLA